MKKIILVLFFLFFSVSALALQLPEKPQHYVNDYTGLLSADSRERIENTLAEFEKTTSNQVVVAIFDSLEGGSLEDFSIHLAEKWKVGQKGRDNGIILLIFKSDRKVRIEVGYGLEGALPDVIANLIIQNEIVPNFRAGNYDAGVEKAVAAILQATRGEYKATAATTDARGAVILFLIIIFVVLVATPRFLFVPGVTYSSRGGFGGGGFSGGGFGGGFSGGGGGFGGGGSSGGW